MEMGSLPIKKGRLYSSTFLLRMTFMFEVGCLMLDVPLRGVYGLLFEVYCLRFEVQTHFCFRNGLDADNFRFVCIGCLWFKVSYNTLWKPVNMINLSNLLNLLNSLNIYYRLPYRLLQICYQIIRIFNTDTQSNQSISQTVFDSFFSGNAGMGHAGRMVDE